MLLLGLSLPLASAAVVTEIPPFLRGDVQVGYRFDLLGGSLVERKRDEDVDVGERSLTDHSLRYGIVFGVAPGAAAFVELPHTVSTQIAFDRSYEMVYDPGTGSGTYEGTAERTPGATVAGDGLGGIWFGVRGTPFSEAFPKRNTGATWLLEGAIRTADESNVWVTDEEGARGAGFGGTAARFHTAFSKTFGKTAPYITGTYVGEGPHTVAVVYPDGTKGPSLDIDPANSGDLRVGAEIVAGENPAAGSLFVFDFHLDVAYDSYAVVPSGFYLPDVLAASQDATVLQAESLEAGGGLGVHWRPFKNMQLSLWGDVAYHLPQRLEFPYPVYTGGDTIHVNAGSTLGVRFR